VVRGSSVFWCFPLFAKGLFDRAKRRLGGSPTGN